MRPQAPGLGHDLRAILFDLVNEGEKNAFLSSNHELAGSALVAKLSESVQLSKKLINDTVYAGSGKYKDLETLEKLYADRPTVLNHSTQHARKFWGPVKSL